MKQQHALYTFSENDPVNIARDFTIFSLSNGTNVHRWRQKETSNYIICQNKKTQLQSGYLTVSSLSSKQYWTTSCHNCFLYLETVCYYQQLWMSYHSIEEFKTKWTNVEMCSLRYHIVIPERNCITVIELTCSFENNLLRLYDYKNNNIKISTAHCFNPWWHFQLILFQVSSLGFIGSSIKTFGTYLNEKNLESIRIIKTC